jgi:C4-dicarboxylate-specific signal transduction histidine kinase
LKKNLEEENQQLKLQIRDLKKQVIEEIRHNRQNDKMMFQQSRMASMGEMIGNIAHQWRQPLMELSSISMELQAKIELLGKVSNEEVLEVIQKSNDITQYMSDTIDDFRNFFSKDKEKEIFKISDQISSAINIINSSLQQHNIKVEIIVQRNSTIEGVKNEYSQVLINILSNAKDALISRKIKDPKISIKILEKDNLSIVEISDNAGGINIKPIEKIFEPFFTHDKLNGTGIGLFMSKLITENNMNGRLFVQNNKKGAVFTITVPRLIKN